MCENKGMLVSQSRLGAMSTLTSLKKASSTLDPLVILSLLLLKPLQIGLRSSGFIELLRKKKKENVTVI